LQRAVLPATTKVCEERAMTMRLWLSLLLMLILPSVFGVSCSVTADEISGPKFETDIAPILEARCLKCHGEGKLEAGLDLRRRFLILKGGDSGAAFVTEKPEESLLLQKIMADEMPPKEEGRLDDKQKALLKRWIATGAKTVAEKETPIDEAEHASRLSEEDRAYWAFQPPKQPAIPPITNHKSQIENPLDAFLLAKLSEKGLSFNIAAPKSVLLRRVTFDLLGLPPTIEELEDFLADESPDAYEQLVDRLLASPRFGERWGRQWLDIAGYADSDGYLAADRLRPEAWRYRDWVIRALNGDLPFDQFVTQQLAGDELSDWRRAEEITPEIYDQLVATGFLRTALDPTYPGYIEPNEVHQVLADTMQIVGSTFLGLTVHCARCHQHKFDPISQRDYYSLQAVFGGALDPARWQPSEVRGIPFASETEETRINAHNQQADARIAALTVSLNDLTLRARRRLLSRLMADGRKLMADLPTQDKLIAAIIIEPAKRNVEQKQLVEQHGAANVTLADSDLIKNFDDYRDDSTKLKAAIAAEAALKKAITRIRGLADHDDKAAISYILRRGDYNKPGAEVTPGVVEVLAPAGFQLAPQAGYKTTGRRTALARWLTAPKHPLLARVHVNRLWAAHFGRGIVPTLANFGRSGVKPSHPELLDWLATEFVNVDESLRDSNSGHGVTGQRWSQKRLHRLIVTSAAYRQSADFDEVKQQLDPNNILLGAWSPKRHQGEVVRDSLLTVSARLNPTPFGKWANVAAQGDGSVIDTDDEPGRRRSIYQIVRRSQHLTMLELFDTPLMEVNCPERTVSTVPLQALAMLHGPMSDRAAGGLSDRLWSAAANDPDRIRFAFRLLFTREPSATETDRIVRTLSGLSREQLANKPNPTDTDKVAAIKAAWQQIALVLLNSNEFVYVH
jgi:hypothetical protein